MNSERPESAKELLKLRNSALACRHSKREGMRFFAFLTSGGGGGGEGVFHDSCAGHSPSNREK